MWAAIAGGVSGLASVIGSWLSARQSEENVKRTIRARKKMAKLAWKRNLKKWRKMRRYNKPKNQMQRFKKAGLNPNLIYGQGTPGNLQGFPRYEAPSISYMGRKSIGAGIAQGVSEGISAYIGTKRNLQQVAVTEAKTEVAEANATARQMKNYILGIDVVEAQVIKNKMSGRLPKGSAMIGTKGSVGPTAVSKIWQNYLAGLSQEKANLIYQQLKNKYQRVESKMAAQEGIKLGEAAKVKAILKLLEIAAQAAGINPKNIDLK